MNLGAIVLIALVAFLFTPFPRLLVAALFGRQIGQVALARQPDTIHLERTEPATLRRADRVRTIAAEYQRCGFEDAGVYAIPEMKEVRVQLLANRRESMYAAIYDHPASGVWYDVVTRYAGGSSYTFTTARPTGLEHRPNAHMTYLPKTEAAVLVAHARTSRPGAGMLAVSAAAAVQDFESSYAEYMAWLKQRGISTHEVVEVARRKAA